MDAHVVFETLMLTLGPSILLTYAWLYFAIMQPSADALYAKRLWGVFGDRGPFFWFWCASVCVCVAAFLDLSVRLCYVDDAALAAHDWVVYPYALFLGGSALYAPLLVYAWPWVVVLDLVCVAGGACALCAWTALHYGSPATCGLTAWLAVHCTLIDACLWSYNWYCRPGYWDADDHWQEVPDHY